MRPTERFFSLRSDDLHFLHLSALSGFRAPHLKQTCRNSLLFWAICFLVASAIGMKDYLSSTRPKNHDYEGFGARGQKDANSKLAAEMKSRLTATKEKKEPDDEGSKAPKLGLRDLLALAVAALETFLLPLLAIAVVIALIAILLEVRP